MLGPRRTIAAVVCSLLALWRADTALVCCLRPFWCRSGIHGIVDFHAVVRILKERSSAAQLSAGTWELRAAGLASPGCELRGAVGEIGNGSHGRRGGCLCGRLRR